MGDLLKGRRTDDDRLSKSTTVPTLKSAVPGDLSFVLPQRHLTSIVEALKAFDKIAPGLYSKNTLLYGVEVNFILVSLVQTISLKHLLVICTP